MSAEKSIFQWTSQWLDQQGLPHESFHLCDSTNDLAKASAFDDPALFIYLADQQAHGRGRGTNTWTSPPPGSALLASWSFELLYPPQQLTAPVVGLQLFRAATTIWPKLKWSLKAPNDLYLGDGKVAGLLTESVSRGPAHRLVIGLGFNVISTPGAVPQATALQAHIPASLTLKDWNMFLSQLNNGFRKASELAGLTTLPEELRTELFQAIKKHPLSQDLTELSLQGDLIYSDRTISWNTI